MIVRGETLWRLARAILEAFGAPADVAAEVATHLIRASLSGDEAQGAGRLVEFASLVESGALDPAARPRVVRESPAAALLDAGAGFGQLAAAEALRWCLDAAPRAGVAVAAIRSAHDVGRLAEYAERAAEAGMLLLATAGVAGPDAGNVMLFGGRARFLGPNPWAFAAPGRDGGLAFEGATSTINAGDALLARAKGGELPPDALLDRFGRPSTDPADLTAGGGLAPLGGAVAGRRGLGMGLASALFGALAMDGVASSEASAVGGALLLVIDPAAFGDADAYRERVDATLASVRESRPAAGHPAVAPPGDQEARARLERAGSGLLVAQTTWAELSALAQRLGVQVDLPEGPGGYS